MSTRSIASSSTAPELLRESPSKAILRLAWPTMASLMVVNFFNLVDAYWVGLLGTQALSGMTASAFLVWCIHSVGMLVGTGVNAVVARRVGEGRPELAGEAAGQGLLLAGALALVATLLGLAAQGPLFRALHLEAAAQQAAVAYMTPMLLGLPTIVGWYAIEAHYRGSGDTFTPMWVISISLGLNMLLDPLLIFGAGPIPALGIAGAAWATVAAHALAIVGCLWQLRRQKTVPQLRWPAGERWRVQPEVLGNLVRVGAPIAASAFLFSLIYIFLTRVIADFGSPAVAALGIGHRVEGLGYYICVGFAASASTLVGQHLGAGQAKEAAQAARLATTYALVVVTAICVATFIFAAPIMGLFADDPLVIAEGKSYLRIIAALGFGMAFEVVLEGAFAGAGNSLPPMLISVPLMVLRVPLAFYLVRSLGYGIDAVWWVISATTLLKGLLITGWFARGRWKRTKL